MEGKSSAIKDEWSVFEGHHNGKPLLVRLNTGVAHIAGNRLYVFRIGIAVPLKHPQENGLPTPEENLYFKDIEDEIHAYFEKEQRGFVCAIISTSGMKEFMMYGKSENVQDLIGILKTKFSAYDFQNYVKRDENWEGYKNLNKPQ